MKKQNIKTKSEDSEPSNNNRDIRDYFPKNLVTKNDAYLFNQHQTECSVIKQPAARFQKSSQKQLRLTDNSLKIFISQEQLKKFFGLNAKPGDPKETMKRLKDIEKKPRSNLNEKQEKSIDVSRPRQKKNKMDKSTKKQSSYQYQITNFIKIKQDYVGIQNSNKSNRKKK